MTTDIKPGKYVPIFNCCIILPPKKDRPETGNDGRLHYKICDRVVSVNPFAACLVEHDMPKSVGYFKSPEDAYSYLKSVEGENFED